MEREKLSMERDRLRGGKGWKKGRMMGVRVVEHLKSKIGLQQNIEDINVSWTGGYVLDGVRILSDIFVKR